MGNEVAAAMDSGGPERPSTDWLILQRLDDLRRSQAELKSEVTTHLDEFRRSQAELKSDVATQLEELRRSQAELQADLTERVGDVRRSQDELKADFTKRFDRLETRVERLDGRIDSVRNWSLGLLLLAILGLLAKLLIPGA